MDDFHLNRHLPKDYLLPVKQQQMQYEKNVKDTESQQCYTQLLSLTSRSGSEVMISRTSRSPSATRYVEHSNNNNNNNWHMNSLTIGPRERDNIESHSLGVTGGIGSSSTLATSLAGSTAISANTFVNASGIGVGVGATGSNTLGPMTGSLGSGGLSAGGGGTSVATFRGFRSQSPSNRRSRERSRTHARTHGSDQGGLLAYGASTGGPVGNLAPIEVGVAEDARLSGDDICYQSFISDDVDGNPISGGGQGDSAGSNKKNHRHHERVSNLQTLDRLTTKIQCTKESIRKEQTARDENVNEYLKLAASADKQQLQRIKAVFEKKNQKSAHNISHLQKKLDSYTKRVKDLQNQQYQNKTQHRQPREVLRDVGHGLRYMGGNIRDGISGFSGTVMAKPKEIAHLIKNKFGSADNINHMSEAELSTPANQDLLGSATPNNVVPATSTGSGGHGSGAGGGGIGVGGGAGGGLGSGKFNSENGSECSSVTSGSMPADSRKSHSVNHIDLNAILAELEERKVETKKLMERVAALENAQKDFNNLTATLESERYRAESLEEQINDLTELHQNEIENLKQAIADMEEKVQYQSDERLQDVNDVLENCQTRISKMEHMSQQQYVTVEGIDNSNARALVVKLINVVLTILQVVLLLVATAAGIIMPFLKTRVRVLTTFLTVFIIICVIRQWPDVQDIGVGLVRHLKQSLVVK